MTNGTRPGTAETVSLDDDPTYAAMTAALDRMDTQAKQRFQVGTRVRVCDPETALPVQDGHRFGGVCVVVKVNPRTIKVNLPNGRGLSADRGLLLVTDEPLPRPETAPFAPVLGGLVRIDTAKARVANATKVATQVFVVCADKGEKIRIALLGGDGGRYWNLPASVLLPVDPAEVLKN